MLVNIPKEELQRNIDLMPDWYDLTYKSFRTEPEKKDGSINWIVEFEVHVDGRIMKHTFYAWMLKERQAFIEAVMEEKVPIIDKKVQKDINFDTEKYLGVVLKGRLESQTSGGRIFRNFVDFLPEGADVKVPF